MFTYVYYVCFMHFLPLISKSCFHKNKLYFIFIYKYIFKVYIYIFKYVISSDGLTKKEPSARKAEGHFFFFQIFLALQKKVIILKEATL